MVSLLICYWFPLFACLHIPTPGFFLLLYVQAAPWARFLKVVVTKHHKVSDLENMGNALSPNSGSQKSGVKVSAGLAPYMRRGKEDGT